MFKPVHIAHLLMFAKIAFPCILSTRKGLASLLPALKTVFYAKNPALALSVKATTTGIPKTLAPCSHPIRTYLAQLSQAA